MGSDDESHGGTPYKKDRRNRTKKHRKGNRKDRSRRNDTPKASKFEGMNETLTRTGVIFDVSSTRRLATDFTKCVETLGTYCCSNLKHGGSEMELALKRFEDPTFNKPTPPTPTVNDKGKSEISTFDKEMYLEDIKAYHRKLTIYADNKKKVMGWIMGQCTESMKAKLRSLSNWEQIESTHDAIELIIAIKTIVYNFQSDRLYYESMYEAYRKFYQFYQTKSMTVDEYLDKFLDMVQMVEYCGGEFGHESNVVKKIMKIEKIDVKKATSDQKKKVLRRGREEYLAVTLLMKACRTRFGKLVEDIQNEYFRNDRGKDFSDTGYPQTIVEAHSLLLNWKNDPRNNAVYLPEKGETGAAFNQREDASSDDEETSEDEEGGAFTQRQRGKERKKTRTRKKSCFICGATDHLAYDCPKKWKPKDDKEREKEKSDDEDEEGAAMLLHGINEEDVGDHYDIHDLEGFVFHIRAELPSTYDGLSCRQGPRFLRKYWILLDSQSTVHIFCNPFLLRNIRMARKALKLHCNAGYKMITLVGDFPGVGEVWFDPTGIANILSMAMISDKFTVTYSSNEGDKFVVSNETGTHREFKRSPTGLYYLDVQAESNRSEGAALINTVVENKNKYSHRAYSRALKARKLQNIIGPPSAKDFLKYMNGDTGTTILNNPVTREDAIAAENILGPSLEGLKGKTVRCKAPRVRVQYTPIPPSLMEKYKNVTIAVDVMKVNKIPFLVSISENIRMATSEMITSTSNARILVAMKNIFKLYMPRGFRIRLVKADGEFESLRGDIADLKSGLNTVSRDEHVPEIERHIRTVKERIRGTYNTLPFSCIPNRMLIELVYNKTFWLNSIPPLNGISVTMSPREIVVGGKIDYKKHCQLEYGEYVQTHEEHDNSMATRTLGAIALRPKGNLQGGHWFLNLRTGKTIDRKHWTPLPMPSDVIDQVHRMARQQNAMRVIEITDRHNQPYFDDNDEDSDDEEDSDYEDDDDDSDDGDDDANNEDDDTDALEADTDDDSDEEDDANEEDIATIDDDNENTVDDDAAAEQQNGPDDDAQHTEPAGVNDTQQPEPTQHLESTQQIQNPNPSHTPEIPDYLEMAQARVDMEQKYGKRSDRYNLRARKPRSYAHLHAQVEEDDVIRHIFTQLNIKQGIKAFGNAGVQAVLKEMKQLHERKVGQPVSPESMDEDDRKKALNYLMFLKKKRCGKIKGRGCADGRKQRVYKTKEETASPTVTTEGLMISATIDAKENRDVATCDIPGAFMQANIDERLHVRLDGKMAELLVRLDKDLYGPHLRHDKKGKPYIYLLLDKALYGTMQAAKFFWEDLSKSLQEWGFKINPYDPCVANKMIKGKQCTILWHVDDMKISHQCSKVVTDIINKLKAKYGKIGELTVTRGKVHDYLGMVIDYRKPGKVQFQMFKYIDEMLKGLPPSMGGEATTPAADHLFQVRDDAVKLDELDADFFHTTTAKALFLSKRAHPDIQTTVAFLCTRVKSPDRDDYKKLGLLMKYLWESRDLPLTLEWDGLNVIKWWADASFAIHKDMRSHTGGVMSLGKGAVCSMSKKQKLNSRSSTEGELIGADDVMPMLLWSINFIRAQGYEVKFAKLYQDSRSAMLLEKNGKASSRKRTRHLNIRYFFITDMIKKGLVDVEYCNTKEMVADYYTKPLQGASFKKFRNMILNIQDP